MTRTGAIASSVARHLIGRPADWRLRRPHLTPPRPAPSWIGPSLVALTVSAAWLAFDGVAGRGSDAFGLWIGAGSIILMAWSFVLSVRLRPLERIFGGLDRMYRVHRWTGVLAVIAMFLHTQNEPDVDGIPGASESMADAAQDLAGTGEVLLYVLVGISLLRWIPYRYWRWTHKLLGVPYVFACWHFYTVEKPYANGSSWGWYFGVIMLGGLVAWIIRVVVRDMLVPGHRYRVTAATNNGTTTALRLIPLGSSMRYAAGQFAVLKLQVRGLKEPHAFTIASAPDDGELRFFIRDLGDWSHRLLTTDLVGATAFVEGPYGHFEPMPERPRPTWWIAGGVGITPFLAAIESLPDQPEAPPTLCYCVRDRHGATGREVVEAAAASGRIRLEWFESSAGRRFDGSQLADLVDAAGGSLAGAHVAVCGPTGLVSSTTAEAHRLGARRIMSEDFDIRSGIGPDLSRQIDELTRQRIRSKIATP